MILQRGGAPLVLFVLRARDEVVPCEGHLRGGGTARRQSVARPSKSSDGAVILSNTSRNQVPFTFRSHISHSPGSRRSPSSRFASAHATSCLCSARENACRSSSSMLGKTSLVTTSRKRSRRPAGLRVKAVVDVRVCP